MVVRRVASTRETGSERVAFVNSSLLAVRRRFGRRVFRFSEREASSRARDRRIPFGASSRATRGRPMGVAGSTQRLRPMVNPDGKVGLKVRAGAHHPEPTNPHPRSGPPLPPSPPLPADRPSSIPIPHRSADASSRNWTARSPPPAPPPSPPRPAPARRPPPSPPRRDSPSGRSSPLPTPRCETQPPSPTTAPCSRASTTPSRAVSEWANCS